MQMPEFMVADEPVSALDVSVQAQVLNLMKGMQTRMHLTMLFISHDLKIVRFLSDRIAVIYLGKIVEVGPSEEFFENPYHPYSKGLLSSILDINPGLNSSQFKIKADVPVSRVRWRSHEMGRMGYPGRHTDTRVPPEPFFKGLAARGLHATVMIKKSVSDA